jgi:hypothetical protein
VMRSLDYKPESTRALLRDNELREVARAYGDELDGQ